MADKKSLDEMLLSLEECVKKLENEDCGLEGSFKLYEEGVKLIAECNKRIAGVEKKVMKLAPNGSIEELDQEIE